MIGYFVYSHFKKTAVLTNVIHKEAESVLKIGIHDIKKTLVLDVLSAPSYYWSNSSFSKRETKKDSIEDKGKGIDFMPYSVVFYTMKDVKNTLFSTFKINDTTIFNEYITKYVTEKKETIKNTKDYKYVSLEKSKVVLAWNSEKLAVAIAPELTINKVQTVFNDVLLKDKLISDKNHSLIKQLANTTDHLVYIKDKSINTINFIDGRAQVRGFMYTDKPDIYNPETVFYTVPNTSLQFFYDANFENKENKDLVLKSIEGVSFFKKNNIDVKTLLDRTNGFFSLEINGSTIQKDTIITYAYDDNFDKVATKTLQEKTVPKILIHLGAEDKSLNTYLKAQGAIQNNILTAMPYYTFYTKEDLLNTYFSTSNKSIATKKRVNPNFLNLKVNFKSLAKDIEIPKLKEVSVLLEDFILQAKQKEGTNELEIKGKLSGVNKDVNIITQLFFGLQEKDTLK